MKALWKRALELKTAIEEERGAVEMLALLDHGKAPDSWHLVIAAPWRDKGLRVGIDYVFTKIEAIFTQQERAAIGAVILLRPTDEFVRNVREEYGDTDGPIELRHCVLNGMDIVHAYLVFAPRKAEAAMAATAASSASPV